MTTKELPVPESGPTPYGYHSDDEIWRCWKEYQYARIRKVHTPKVEVASAHGVGLLFHAGRARWFRLRFDTSSEAWQSIRDAMEAEARSQNLPVTIDSRNKATELLREYIDYWSGRPLPRVVDAEYLIGPASLYPDALDSNNYLRTARLDDLSYYPLMGSSLCAGESKTTSGNIGAVIKYYQMHPQPMLQKLLFKLAPQGEARHGPLAGIMLDIVKKPSGKSRCQFEREFIPIEDKVLEEFRQSYIARLLGKRYVTWNSRVDRNFEACSRGIAGGLVVDCAFKDLCIHGRVAAGKYYVDKSPMPEWRPTDENTIVPWD